MEYAAILSLFLVAKSGSCLGRWIGNIPAAEQRAICGRVIGRGKIVIDGTSETICNRVRVCFGADYDDRNMVAWRDL